MKFDEKYKEVVQKYKEYSAVFPRAAALAFNNPEFEPEPCLLYTGALFGCDTGMGGCGQATGWRDFSWGVPVPTCSDECRQAMTDQCTDICSRNVVVDPSPPSIPMAKPPSTHADHGRQDAQGEPEHSDCPCRDTDDQTACAVAGCGFCVRSEIPS